MGEYKSTFIENLEENIAILHMWIKKQETEMPIAAGFMACAAEDLANAIRYAKEKR